MSTKVKFTVKVGEGAPSQCFTVEVHPDWAPNGAERFLTLCGNGYFEKCRFHRVVKDFMVQFGLAADPAVYKKWGTNPIKDDPVTESNVRGTLSFAMRGPDTRSTQIFINFGDNKSLDSQGFSPIAKVIEGMEVVDQFYGGYGDYPPRGEGPEPDRIKAEGLEYVKSFPKLSYIEKVEML
mmetsp:Transcript_37940/g.100356  ORF Transcript_37940/g.100356 Transcript_37940/m.100356 type:complete len:180 (+) Transcript_37940:106-645(+)